MRNLHRLLQNVPTTNAMLNLLRADEVLQATAIDGVDEICVRDNLEDQDVAVRFPALKKMALGIMQLLEGSILGQVTLVRIDPKASLPLPTKGPDELCLMVLNASSASRLMAGDEAVEVNAGDAWWVKRDVEARLINPGGASDDLVVLVVDVRVDH